MFYLLVWLIFAGADWGVCSFLGVDLCGGVKHAKNYIGKAIRQYILNLEKLPNGDIFLSKFASSWWISHLNVTWKPLAIPDFAWEVFDDVEVLRKICIKILPHPLSQSNLYEHTQVMFVDF